MKKIILLACFIPGILYCARTQNNVSSDLPGIHEYIFVEQEPRILNFEEIRKRVGYPLKAIKAGIEGKVYFRVLVNQNGECQKYVITRLAHPLLNEAASKYIEQLKFSPARVRSTSVAYWINVPFRFSLVDVPQFFTKEKGFLAGLRRKLFQGEKKAQVYYEKGKSLYDQKQYDQALLSLSKSVLRNPGGKRQEHFVQLTKTHFLIGKTLQQQGNWKLALEHFTEAIGIARSRLSDTELSEDLIPRLYMKRVLCLIQTYESVRALRDAQYLMQNYEDYRMEGLLYSGLALNRLGQHEQALANIEEAIELMPSNPLAHYYKSIVLSDIGGDEFARESLNRAKELGLTRK